MRTWVVAVCGEDHGQVGGLERITPNKKGISTVLLGSFQD